FGAPSWRRTMQRIGVKCRARSPRSQPHFPAAWVSACRGSSVRALEDAIRLAARRGLLVRYDERVDEESQPFKNDAELLAFLDTRPGE
ncbi:MAG: hypothetical protein R6W48_09275, partial [Gaiellaceae bacterium]